MTNKELKMKSNWMMSEKHYITKDELIEFAKIIWFQASGEKATDTDIMNFVTEEMTRMYWRDSEWKI